MIDTDNKIRRNEFNIVYMNMAENIALLSRAVRKKVGCILIDENDNIISYGFNGTPKGSDNNCEDIDENGNLVTKSTVLHAESNAITKVAKSNSSSTNSTMYVTLMPCLDCAKLIIQSGVKKVYYKEEYRDDSGIVFLKKLGVNVIKL